MTATEQDRERADSLIEFASVADVNVDTLRALIAAALADERDRARAPFLALATEAETDAAEVWLYPGETHPVAVITAEHIRRAAEDPQ